MANTHWDGLEDRVWRAGVSHAIIYTDSGYINNGGSYIWHMYDTDSSGKQSVYTHYRMPRKDGTCYAWNGLTSVNENIVGNDIQYLYDHGNKFLGYQAIGDLEGSINCYTYPDVVDDLIKNKRMFNLSYQIKMGNGIGEYKYPIIRYLKNLIITSYSFQYNTINTSIDPVSFTLNFVAFKDTINNSLYSTPSALPIEIYNLNDSTYTDSDREEIKNRFYSDVAVDNINIGIDSASGYITKYEVITKYATRYILKYISDGNALSENNADEVADNIYTGLIEDNVDTIGENNVTTNDMRKYVEKYVADVIANNALATTKDLSAAVNDLKESHKEDLDTINESIDDIENSIDKASMKDIETLTNK